MSGRPRASAKIGGRAWLRIGDARCRVIGVLTQLGLAGGFKVDETVILPVANAQVCLVTSAAGVPTSALLLGAS